MSFTVMMLFLILAIPVAVITGAILVVLFRLVAGSSSRTDKALQADETKLIQEIHQGLIRMEKRIEALETIVIDRDGKKEES